MIRAPWTPEQVDNLNAFQQSGLFHGFTCGVESCRAVLVATPAGWVCPREGCEYTQDWAGEDMADGIIVEAMRAAREKWASQEKEETQR